MIRLTSHAINRYRERHRPDLTFEDCAAILAKYISHATPLRSRSKKGDHQYIIQDLGIILVVKPTRTGSALDVVTILAHEPEIDDDTRDEVLAAARRAGACR